MLGVIVCKWVSYRWWVLVSKVLCNCGWQAVFFLILFLLWIWYTPIPTGLLIVLIFSRDVPKHHEDIGIEYRVIKRSTCLWGPICMCGNCHLVTELPLSFISWKILNTRDIVPVAKSLHMIHILQLWLMVKRLHPNGIVKLFRLPWLKGWITWYPRGYTWAYAKYLHNSSDFAL